MPRVTAELAPGWVEANIERPPIAETSGAHFASWNAWRRDDAALVVGCVATPIPGWVEDMRTAVEARTVALAGAVAAKISGAPVDARDHGDGTFDLRAAANLSGPVIGRARTFVGFDAAPEVFTCFASCVGGRGYRGPDSAAPDVEACEQSVEVAKLADPLPPPPAGLLLGVGTWAVHHPRQVASGGASLVILASCLLVFLRRRPRSRAPI